MLVLFLSALALGVLAYLGISSARYRSMDARYAARAVLEDSVRELMKQLADDPTPEADSLRDPLWTWLSSRGGDLPVLELEDISSRFNLNFVRTKMLEESEFGSMMLSGKTPEDLKQWRGEEGFAGDLVTGYGDFYKEEDLGKYFTVYSYANLNVTYEDSLKKLYEIRVSPEGAHVFLSSVQSLIAGGVMADEERMKQIFGSSEGKLFPLINIEPLINVNFADEKILKAVLFYPYGEEVHEQAADYLDVLTAERTTMEITRERLQSLIEAEDQYLRIFQYLGTTTWFWRIKATSGADSLDAVICRLPGKAGEKKEYKVLEWKFNS